MTSASGTIYAKAEGQRVVTDTVMSRAVQRVAGSDGSAATLGGEVLKALARIAGADAAAVMVRRTGTVVAAYPSLPDGGAPPWVQALEPMLTDAPKRGGPVTLSGLGVATAADPFPRLGQGVDIVLLPVIEPDGRSDLVALFRVPGGPASAAAARQRLDVGAALIALCRLKELVTARQRGTRAVGLAVETLATVGRHLRFGAAAIALCNEVAARWSAARVSFGVMRGAHPALLAMSGTDRIDRKRALVRAIEDAMAECLDQGERVAWPDDDAGEADGAVGTPVVARAARQLSTGFGGHTVLCLPMIGADDAPMAALLVEFDSDSPPSRQDRDALALLAVMAAPLLFRLHDHDRWAGAKLVSTMRRTATDIVGPGHAVGKLGALIAIGAGVMLAVLPIADRVRAPFVLQAVDRQIVAAPFDGYLAEVHVRPGDQVTAGETVLARLDDSQLRLELADARAERASLLAEARIATRDGRIAEAQIAEARADRVAATIALTEDRLARAEVRSPRSGVVVEGDRLREVGGAVDRGQPLFEIVPIERLQAELRVPQARIAGLEPGQTGSLALAAEPGRHLPMRVVRVEPMAIADEGRTLFRVWAEIGADELPQWLRPGMAGSALVTVGDTTPLVAWTRDAVAWVRMALWL